MEDLLSAPIKWWVAMCTALSFASNLVALEMAGSLLTKWEINHQILGTLIAWEKIENVMYETKVKGTYHKNTQYQLKI